MKIIITTKYINLNFQFHLLSFVKAMLVTVGEVEARKLFSQLMLGCGNHVQGHMKFSMARSLKWIMSGFNNRSENIIPA